jgi:hypothetical protein
MRDISNHKAVRLFSGFTVGFSPNSRAEREDAVGPLPDHALKIGNTERRHLSATEDRLPAKRLTATKGRHVWVGE